MPKFLMKQNVKCGLKYASQDNVGYRYLAEQQKNAIRRSPLWIQIAGRRHVAAANEISEYFWPCLLYTSDAADE